MSESTPRLVFDDDCGFCTWCAYFAERHGDVHPVGFTDLSPDQTARLPADWEDCAHLLTDDDVYSCGAAIEETLKRDFGWLRPVFALLHLVPGYESLREWLYRWGANRRDWWGNIVREEPPAKA